MTVTNSNLFDWKIFQFKNIWDIKTPKISFNIWKLDTTILKESQNLHNKIYPHESFKAFKNREKIKKSYQSSITRLQVKYYKQDIPTAICTPIKTKKTLNPYPSSTVPSSTISAGPRKTSTRIIQKRSPPLPSSHPCFASGPIVKLISRAWRSLARWAGPRPAHIEEEQALERPGGSAFSFFSSEVAWPRSVDATAGFQVQKQWSQPRAHACARTQPHNTCGALVHVRMEHACGRRLVRRWNAPVPRFLLGWMALSSWSDVSLWKPLVRERASSSLGQHRILHLHRSLPPSPP